MASSRHKCDSRDGSHDARSCIGLLVKTRAGEALSMDWFKGTFTGNRVVKRKFSRNPLKKKQQLPPSNSWFLTLWFSTAVSFGMVDEWAVGRVGHEEFHRRELCLSTSSDKLDDLGHATLKCYAQPQCCSRMFLGTKLPVPHT